MNCGILVDIFELAGIAKTNIIRRCFIGYHSFHYQDGGYIPNGYIHCPYTGNSNQCQPSKKEFIKRMVHKMLEKEI
jgi:hypothetical protein